MHDYVIPPYTQTNVCCGQIEGPLIHPSYVINNTSTSLSKWRPWGFLLHSLKEAVSLHFTTTLWTPYIELKILWCIVRPWELFVVCLVYKLSGRAVVSDKVTAMQLGNTFTLFYLYQGQQSAVMVRQMLHSDSCIKELAVPVNEKIYLKCW